MLTHGVEIMNPCTMGNERWSHENQSSLLVQCFQAECVALVFFSLLHGDKFQWGEPSATAWLVVAKDTRLPRLHVTTISISCSMVTDRENRLGQTNEVRFPSLVSSCVPSETIDHWKEQIVGLVFIITCGIVPHVGDAQRSLHH